jgi:hypothetical protein
MKLTPGGPKIPKLKMILKRIEIIKIEDGRMTKRQT